VNQAAFKWKILNCGIWHCRSRENVPGVKWGWVVSAMLMALGQQWNLALLLQSSSLESALSH